MGSWTTWFIDFSKHGDWNKRGGAKFEPFLVNGGWNNRAVGGKF